MIGRKYINFLFYKYKRFNVWFNKKADKYCHNSVIVDRRPYDYKAVRKIKRKCNNHLSNFIGTIGVIIIMMMMLSIIIAC